MAYSGKVVTGAVDEVTTETLVSKKTGGQYHQLKVHCKDYTLKVLISDEQKFIIDSIADKAAGK